MNRCRRLDGGLRPTPVQTVLGLAIGSFLLAVGGCSQNSTGNETLNPAANEPVPAAPTFSDYAVPPKPEVTTALLDLGERVYAQNCAACHGEDGDGKAAASAFLLPKPRDFQQANYRLRSTSAGQLPTDVDLFRSVSLGMPGTPMPPWRHILPENERWAVVEYIKTFSPRFADDDEPWTIVELGAPPPRDPSLLAEGKALYAKLACNACHGETGRGDGLAAPGLTDDFGQRIKPRDFSKPGGFKSGFAAKEIVRSILTGFNGTPMLGFEGAIPTDDAWKIAYYVQSLVVPTVAPITLASQNFLEREELGPPDIRIQLTERAWRFDPEEIRVRKGQIVEVTFEPTDNGLGAGHGFAISSYDEVAFINGAMVGLPKTVKFRADRAGKFTYYCSTQCSTDKLHPLMNGTFYVEEIKPPQTAALE